ncbi:16S rRNA (cytosine(1402)-N(4))-methyltransferase RsmH [Salinisphaera orenii]|uniref:Ribosomal RNA small subunit methyltransferase H n=1 Tax=Salinisphaera orenii YIM 95161 TaxID=1051139 RepID=A0A423QAP9_9GAMM|nr:16S rRNA methyltransferase [Salinisphaera halophila YIM 95161]
MRTAADMPQAEHQPVLLDAALAALEPRESGICVDATYGRGGHSRAILGVLGAGGRLVAIDQDPDAAADAEALAARDPRLTFVRGSFRELRAHIEALGLLGRVDALLFDLGVSSPQFDVGARGFSFRHDGPLDMRMDPDAGAPVSDWLNRASHGEIASVIKRLGDEPFAGRIAGAIVAARAEAPVATTRRLAELVVAAVPARVSAGKRIHPATRTFQALRMHVNDELAALEAALEATLDVLAPGGRLAVISFHSLEDRRVKRFMRTQARPAPPPVPMAAAPDPALRLQGRAVRAGADEAAANPRARSAIMRVAERTSAPRVSA